MRPTGFLHCQFWFSPGFPVFPKVGSGEREGYSARVAKINLMTDITARPTKLIRLLLCLLTLCILSGCTSGDGSSSSTPTSDTNDAYQLSFLSQPGDVLTAQDFEVQVEVLDSSGYRVTSDLYPISISIDANPGGGTLTGRLERYPVNGVATFSGLQIDFHGQGYQLAASSPYTYSDVSIPFSVLERGGTGPGPGNHLEIQNIPATVVSGIPISPAIQVLLKDTNNNVVTNITQDVNLQASNGGLLGNNVAVLNNGVAVFTGLALAKAGTVNVTATSLNLNSVTSANFVVVPGPAQVLNFFTPPQGGIVLGPLAPLLQAEITDAQGNRVPTATNVIQVAAQGGPGLLLGSTSKAAVQGLATFPDLSLNAAGVYQLVLTSGPLQTTGNLFRVAAANGTKLAFQQNPPATVALGIPLRLVVGFTDATGNLLSQINGEAITVSILPGQDTVNGATLDGQNHVLQQTTIGGVVTFANLFPDRVGAYNMTLSAPGVPSLTTTLQVTP